MPGVVINRGTRKDGSTKWRARWHHPDDSAIVVEKMFRDRDVARRTMGKWDRDAHSGILRPVSTRNTFDDLVDAWRETRYASLAPSSRKRYDQVLKNHLEPEFAGMRVASIDREAVRRYVGRMARRVADGKMSGGSVHKIHTVLSSILTEAVELGWIPANPARRVRGMPSSKRRRPAVFLTTDEAESLIDAMDARYRLLVRFALYTGLRQGEIFALRRRHVDVLHGRVRVEDAIKEWIIAPPQPQRPKPEPVFGDTKSGRGRTVGLEPRLKTELTDHLAALPGGPDALVWTSDHSGAIRATSWGRNFYRPAVLAALPARSPTFHDLRHTCASWLIKSGANPLEIKNWMGHASVSTTYDIYGHLFPDDVDDLASRLAAKPSNVTPLKADESSG